MSVREKLFEYIRELRIIDSHEHLPAEADRPKNTDVLAEWLSHYFSCDLVSAGLSREGMAFVRDSSKPLAKRWKTVEPYWQAASSTGYGRSLDIAARGLYGIDGVTAKTIGKLNEAFVAAREKGNHYQYVLKDKSRIALSILDSDLSCDRRFFASTVRMDGFLAPPHRAEAARQGEAVGVKVHNLDDWEQAMELHLYRAFEKGAVTLKCGLAYQRTLHFAKACRAEAEGEFNRMFDERYSPEWRPGTQMSKAFQDYMMHRLLSMADRRGLPCQFHTGIQEGNGNVISDANPVLLTNLFLEYENVRFDVFHMGYPYCMELSNLAKNFRNVFIDMCWGHIISPEAARRALVEWLDAVPANKIIGFGGDYCFADGVYGHQELARRNIAASLAQKVEDGSFDIDRAKQIARMVLVDNPTAIFNLKGRLAAARAGPKRRAKRN